MAMPFPAARLGSRPKRRIMARWIRIIATPPGEAPEHIRAAWVGLALPLASEETEPATFATEGVVTGKSEGHTAGYQVLIVEAIRILEREKPQAADWWKT